MDDKQELYMPPCCMHWRLPKLLRLNKHPYFLSEGDWGLAKLWHAASLLVPSREPVFTLLVMEQVDEFSLNLIKENLAHKWIQAIALVTEQDCLPLVQKHLAGFLDRVWYVGNRPEAGGERGFWLRTNGTLALTIMGPIHHGEGFGHICQYSGQYEEKEPSAFFGDNVVHPLMVYRSILRVHSKLKGNDPLFKTYL